MTVKSKVKTKTIFICVSIMSPISNPRPYLTHSRCHYLLYFAKVCFSPCLRYLFMRLCVWHCISLSEKPGKKEVGGGDDKVGFQVHCYPCGSWIADRRISFRIRKWISCCFGFGQVDVHPFAKSRISIAAKRKWKANCSLTWPNSLFTMATATAHARPIYGQKNNKNKIKEKNRV